MQFATGAVNVKELGRNVLKWLRGCSDPKKIYPLPRELRELSAELDITSEFTTTVSQVLHLGVEYFRSVIEDNAINVKNLEFECRIDPDARGCYLLIPLNDLLNCLSNLVINPAKEMRSARIFESAAIITRGESAPAENRISIRLLTSFADHQEAEKRTSNSTHSAAAKHLLQKFGVIFDDGWKVPSGEEMEQGYRAAYGLTVMTGFAPRSRGK
jgi:hypothetical protein